MFRSFKCLKCVKRAASNRGLYAVREMLQYRQFGCIKIAKKAQYTGDEFADINENEKCSCNSVQKVLLSNKYICAPAKHASKQIKETELCIKYII